MIRDVHPASGSQIQHNYKNPCGSGYDELFWAVLGIRACMYSMVIYEDLSHKAVYYFYSDPDPHQRVKVFPAQKLVSKLSQI